ncbi:unnamed protein product [Schistocephalus solidus]|uniref:VHS domain-containing protein n=1 Tax=Schistocephalus solidus TaxID=70667 RepID=A0A183SR74_SCHSO|nr:unnamed protein product [Schistocephalus solidus]
MTKYNPKCSEQATSPKDAIRAIRKRLTSSAGKDHLSVWYTLLLIEACVKNCGKRFQAQVANRDFLRDLIKLLLPKYDAPIQIQTKVLLMLKGWVDSCWDVPGRRELEKVYTALRRKGVQFPITAADDNSKGPPPSIINFGKFVDWKAIGGEGGEYSSLAFTVGGTGDPRPRAMPQHRIWEPQLIGLIDGVQEVAAHSVITFFENFGLIKLQNMAGCRRVSCHLRTGALPPHRGCVLGRSRPE